METLNQYIERQTAQDDAEHFAHVEYERFWDALNSLVDKLDAIETRKHLENGFTNFPADKVHSKDGKKFVKIDIGGSGAWMVEKSTGEIFNIQGYGTVDRNKKRKADIGNIFTVDAELMHKARYNNLR